MGAESLTDERIQELLTMPKRITNPKARWRDLGRHRQVNYEVVSDDGDLNFEIYCRQSLRMPDNFSCGLRWLAPSGEDVHLVRYNGPGHPHENPLEGDRFAYKSHVHRATERYIALGRRAESFAQATDRYRTLNGAIGSLLRDCSIQGLEIEAEDTTGDLFNDS